MCDSVFEAGTRAELSKVIQRSMGAGHPALAGACFIRLSLILLTDTSVVVQMQMHIQHKV